MALDTKVTHTRAPNAAAVEDSLLGVMLAKAREMPTDALQEQYDEGLRLGTRATLFAPTMTVLELALAERKRAACSEVTR